MVLGLGTGTEPSGVEERNLRMRIASTGKAGATGVGMVTPAGTRAASACAALRAGISRVGAWPRLGFAGEPLNAAAIPHGRRDASWVEKGRAADFAGDL